MDKATILRSSFVHKAPYKAGIAHLQAGITACRCCKEIAFTVIEVAVMI
jgi:hypothetical protein